MALSRGTQAKWGRLLAPTLCHLTPTQCFANILPTILRPLASWLMERESACVGMVTVKGDERVVGVKWAAAKCG